MGDLARSLDSDSLQEVLARCRVPDLVSLMQTCKFMRDLVATSPLVWVEQFWKEFGWELNEFERSRLKVGLLDEFKSVFQKSTLSNIRFQGFYTNGGIDSGNHAYWSDNAFKPDTSPYCSSASANVDIVGVLLKNHGTKAEAETKMRQYLWRRCRIGIAFMDRLRFNAGPNNDRFSLDTYSDLQLMLFFHSLYRAYRDPNQDTAWSELLFYRVLPESIDLEQQQADDVNAYLIREDVEKMNSLVGKDSDVCYNKQMVEPIRSRELDACVIETIEISRQGQLTCPVACGAVYGCRLGNLSVADTLVQDLTESLSRLAELNSVESLENLIDKSEQGLLPSIEKITVVEKKCFVEFERKRSISKSKSLFPWVPIGWFHFSVAEETISNLCGSYISDKLVKIPRRLDDLEPSHESSEAHMDDIITGHLVNKLVVNSIAVKLISPENRMEEMLDSHPWPNIDIASIRIHGKLLESHE